MPRYVGYTCSYAPLPLIEAAGFVPYRILPLSEAPERAGELLHDNLCPHVKRVLDRALDQDLPELAGVVFVNSCDAMRRLADAWRRARPEVPALVLDLPTAVSAQADAYLAGELERVGNVLESWGGSAFDCDVLAARVAVWSELATVFARARDLLRRGLFPGGAAALQTHYNLASSQPAEVTRQTLELVLAGVEETAATTAGVPLLLFGNVLADPEALSMIEGCGARVVGDDLCTGARMLARLERAGEGDPLRALASTLLSGAPCARTLFPASQDSLEQGVIRAARDAGAHGVVGHVLKFCDPYLARMPALQRALRAAGLPLLVLEGDCTLRSLGQQRTRIEAFIETLG